MRMERHLSLRHAVLQLESTPSAGPNARRCFESEKSVLNWGERVVYLGDINYIFAFSCAQFRLVTVRGISTGTCMQPRAPHCMQESQNPSKSQLELLHANAN